MNEISLKEHFEARIQALEKAGELASKILEHRLEGMNEFREQLNRQAGTFITKEQVRLIYDPDIRILREALAEAKGRAGAATYIAILAIIISIIEAVILIVT